MEILAKTDVAVLVVDSVIGKQPKDEEMISHFENRKVPYIVVYNKVDLLSTKPLLKQNEIFVSAIQGIGINELKEKIGSLAKQNAQTKVIVSDLINKGDIVVLCIPIDESAPKGRLILPQQMTIRDILDTCRQEPYSNSMGSY